MYGCNYTEADYNGWRRPNRTLQYRPFNNVHIFNIAKSTPDFVGNYDYPDLLKAHMDEIEVFQKGATCKCGSSAFEAVCHCVEAAG